MLWGDCVFVSTKLTHITTHLQIWISADARRDGPKQFFEDIYGVWSTDLRYQQFQQLFYLRIPWKQGREDEDKSARNEDATVPKKTADEFRYKNDHFGPGVNECDLMSKKSLI